MKASEMQNFWEQDVGVVGGKEVWEVEMVTVGQGEGEMTVGIVGVRVHGLTVMVFIGFDA